MFFCKSLSNKKCVKIFVCMHEKWVRSKEKKRILINVLIQLKEHNIGDSLDLSIVLAMHYF